MVRLEAELALERGHDRTLDAALAGEGRTAELSVDEELAVEDRGRRVEGRARHGRVDVVLRGDGVCNQEPDDLQLIEATSVVKASQNRVDSVC